MSLLSERIKITRAISTTAGAAGATDIEGATLDMSGWDGVLCIVTFGAIVTNAVTTLKWQQDSASGMGTVQDLLGTSITVADDKDETVFWMDLYKPSDRYVRVYVDRATQNATCTAHYIQYKGRSLAATIAGTGVTTGEAHVSPAEGTA